MVPTLAGFDLPEHWNHEVKMMLLMLVFKRGNDSWLIHVCVLQQLHVPNNMPCIMTPEWHARSCALLLPLLKVVMSGEEKRGINAKGRKPDVQVQPWLLTQLTLKVPGTEATEGVAGTRCLHVLPKTSVSLISSSSCVQSLFFRKMVISSPTPQKTSSP